MKDFIENPKIDEPYLIRRNKGGSLAKRFEPAVIVDIDQLDGGIRVFQVKFLYDGFQTDVTAYSGLVKELQPAWISNEFKLKQEELSQLIKTVQVLEKLKNV